MTVCKHCRKRITKKLFLTYDVKTFDYIHCKDNNMFCGDGKHWAEPAKEKK
jgi:hypothetical protein